MRRCPRTVAVDFSEYETRTRIKIEAMRAAGMRVRRVGPVTAMVTTPDGFTQRVRFDTLRS